MHPTPCLLSCENSPQYTPPLPNYCTPVPCFMSWYQSPAHKSRAVPGATQTFAGVAKVHTSCFCTGRKEGAKWVFATMMQPQRYGKGGIGHISITKLPVWLKQTAQVLRRVKALPRLVHTTAHYYFRREGLGPQYLSSFLVAIYVATYRINYPNTDDLNPRLICMQIVST